MTRALRAAPQGAGLYNGPGHAGNGRRTPSAAAVAGGVLTINGDADGNSEGMAWAGAGTKYGRWEARVRAPVADKDYHAVLLLWPDNEQQDGNNDERLAHACPPQSSAAAAADGQRWARGAGHQASQARDSGRQRGVAAHARAGT